MEKYLTVVIPTYNMERYLDRCLTSLIVEEDKMDGLEVLVINDGSKDRSSEIAHGYETKYPKTFRVIDKENGNYGSCVNRGLTEAAGKYIKILDADDTYDTKAFSAFLDVLSMTDVDCVISDMNMVNEDGAVTGICGFNLPHDMSEISMSSVVHVAEKMWMHCVCYKTDNIRSAGYKQTEGISYTDQEWIGLPAACSGSFIYYPNVVYLYLVGRSGQTINPKVWEKNFEQEIKGVNVMMQERVEFSSQCSLEGLEYFDKRISHRVKTIYYNYFLLFAGMKNNDSMAALDRKLLQYDGDLYEDLGASIVMFKSFHFLSYWRMHDYKNSLGLLLIKRIFRIKNRKVSRYYL